jgi:hypothetical protein
MEINKMRKEIVDALSALSKYGEEEEVLMEKSDYREFEGVQASKNGVELYLDKNPDVQALTLAILALSYELEQSRYEILNAIKLNIENNY